ncbi:MAG: hypothetical protein HOP96_11995 [Sphingomonas sp.]|nr:hypothetical protein [Sphingomonas sp.]
MSKRLSLIAGIVLLSMPTLAVAKDRPERRVQALLACQSVADNAARLACYDQAMSSLKQALAQGSMVLKERKSPLALEGTVKSSGHWGGSSLWVLLDNGDRWSIQPTKSRHEPPPPGTVVRLKRTLMGTYWISGPKWPESEAEFLGHEG